MNNVDEVETTERAFLSELISSILNLSYASLCNDAIWNSIECEGCQKNWSSQKDHWCMILCNEHEEAWYYYYDEALKVVSSHNVWNVAREVAEMLEINIHPSWRNFINELYKLPRTTTYLMNYQIESFANESDTRVNQILTVLEISLKINTKRKTLTKASTLMYLPEQLDRYMYQAMGGLIKAI